MGNYTIKGLAKANECEEHDAYNLASIWHYWLMCNSCTTQVMRDFRRLNRKNKQAMLSYLLRETIYKDVFNHIVDNLFK